MSTPRRVFMLLSPRSLSYASHALDSLLLRSSEPLALTLITDSEADKVVLTEAVASLPADRHTVTVLSEADLDPLETKFAAYPALIALRHGNPCWRKITDPLLLSEDDEEMIVLDPDIFFPNRFAFEPTPQTGVLLMWQKPNCLLPYEVVGDLLDTGVALSQHVDIGVAQLRFSTVDLSWLNDVVSRIDLVKHRKWMHIEAILWSAMLSRFGGGYLSPEAWICWRRTQWKRALIKLKFSDVKMMSFEHLANAKVFHAGGGAKQWIVSARQANMLDLEGDRTAPTPPLAARAMTRSDLDREVRFKNWLKRLGYYALFPAN